jgi:hypothetical protein
MIRKFVLYLSFKLEYTGNELSVDAGIMLKRNFYLNTLLFADDQGIIQDSEDKLQKPVYILNQMSKDYNSKMSADNTKMMAFKRKTLSAFLNKNRRINIKNSEKN